MSDSYETFLDNVKVFQDLRISTIGLYAGTLAISKQSSNSVDVFTAISRIERDLTVYPHSRDVALSLMYRISLGLLQDAELMIELLKQKNYESLSKMTLEDKSFSARVSLDHTAPSLRDDSLQLHDSYVPSIPISLLKRNSSSQLTTSKPIEKLNSPAFRQNYDEETRNILNSAPNPLNQSIPLSNIPAGSLPTFRPIPFPMNQSINTPIVKQNTSPINPEPIRLSAALSSRVASIPQVSSSQSSCAESYQSAQPIPSSHPVAKCDACNAPLCGERIELPICCHKFHKDCLINTVNVLYECGLNITCPAANCMQNVRDIVSSYLSNSPTKPLLAASEVHKMIKCPNSSCSNMIRDTDSTNIQCTRCNSTYCKQCNEKSHIGIPCPLFYSAEGIERLMSRTFKAPISYKPVETIYCKNCKAVIRNPSPGELIRCDQCSAGHCATCYNVQFDCICEKNKINCGVKHH